MKKIILSLVIGIFTLGFVSCKNEREKNIDKMSSYVKTCFNDNAFKYNEVFNFIEFKPMDYVIKPETYIDSIHLSRNLEKLNMYNELLGTQNELLKNKRHQYELYANLFGPNDPLSKIEKEEFEDLLKEGKEYCDSINYYVKQDSLINQKIKANTKPDSIYMFKVFVKGTATSKNNETTNVCDTFYYFFNKELKPINL